MENTTKWFKFRVRLNVGAGMSFSPSYTTIVGSDHIISSDGTLTIIGLTEIHHFMKGSFNYFSVSGPWFSETDAGAAVISG